MNGWKRILVPVFVLLLISMLTGLLGCDLLTSSSSSYHTSIAPSTPEKGILTTRLQDITGGTPPTVETFGAGELPCVYVYGYGGQTVTVEVYNTSTGESIQGATKKTYTIPNGLNAWWQYPDLPSGAYKAVLEVGGAERHAVIFWVTR